MSDSNLLFESLFKQKLSATSSREYLAQITEEFPYFSPAQFFLLLVSTPGSTAYEMQATKTSLFFNNAWWLQFQLQENRPLLENSEEIDIGYPPIILPESKENIVHPFYHPVETPVTEQNIDSNIRTEIDPVVNEASFSPILEGVESLEDENNTQVVGDEKAGIPLSVETIISLPDNWVKIAPGHDLNEASVLPEPATSIETDLIHPEIQVLPLVKIADEINDILPSVHFNKESSLLENEPEAEEASLDAEETAPLNFKLNIDTSTTTEDSITFEPLHTTDYFASVGIKLSGEVQSSDKLGKQLKSFTEWLKTMKKIHPDQIIPLSASTDSTIQKLAEASNVEGEVVTEAMAAVLLQQGKKDKAIEVFKKLSLLNTSKSAYFAAKIDQLKH